MGTDPILTDVPLVVPVGMIICLIALIVTAWPIFAGYHVSDRRRRQATWGSWACLAGVVVAMTTGLAPGLYGFLTLATFALVAAATLLRSRFIPVT